MKTTILRTVGIVCAVMIAFEVSFAWFHLSEVCDDALRKARPNGFVPLLEFLIAVAPFGLFPLVTPVLVGVLFWLLTSNIVIRGHELIFPILFAAFGMIALAVCTEYSKQFSYLDGARSGPITAWIFNGALNAGMLWMILRLLKADKIK